MTIRIALSKIKALPFDFDAAVKEFIEAKKKHRTTVGEPSPNAPHLFVEAAVRRVPGSIEEQRPDDFVADYEVVDDTPPEPPKPSLDQRKMALAAQVGTAANAAVAKIIPPLKHRLWEHEYARVQADMAKVKIIENESLDDWRARAIVAIKKTSAADFASFTAHDERKKKIAAVHYHVALCESQIHDLTEETIDAWSPAPFPA